MTKNIPKSLMMGISSYSTMSYEPGTLECRQLIEAKENLISAMKSLSNIEGTESIQKQLRTIYNKLEEKHEIMRIKELKAC